MKILWYPNYDEEGHGAAVKIFIRKELIKYKDLRFRVESFLKRLRVIPDIWILFNSEQIAFVKDGLCEMRIPKQRRGGVVRVYFCFGKKEKDTIVLLDAELKHETSPGRIGPAFRRMTDYINSNKG